MWSTVPGTHTPSLPQADTTAVDRKGKEAITYRDEKNSGHSEKNIFNEHFQNANLEPNSL